MARRQLRQRLHRRDSGGVRTLHSGSGAAAADDARPDDLLGAELRRAAAEHVVVVGGSGSDADCPVHGPVPGPRRTRRGQQSAPARRFLIPEVVLRGFFSAADRRRYHDVPFTVPAGVRALHVEYSYSDRIASDPRLLEGNTLDIGLFDPIGFRGWSGSHKDAFTLCEEWATPPYLAGPVVPGTWKVLLGPYKV